MVQLLVQKQEFLDALHSGELPVGFLHFFIDQVIDFRMLRQTFESGEGDVSVLSPLAHRFILDLDEGGQIRPAVADYNSLVNIRTAFEAILNFRRGDVLSAARDDNGFLAVRDREISVLPQDAHVAGVQPSVAAHRLGG